MPFFFKHAVDALTLDPTGATPVTMLGLLALTPPAMLAGYGMARAGSAFCGELRNLVFAKVGDLGDLGEVAEVAEVAGDGGGGLCARLCAGEAGGWLPQLLRGRCRCGGSRSLLACTKLHCSAATALPLPHTQCQPTLGPLRMRNPAGFAGHHPARGAAGVQAPA